MFPDGTATASYMNVQNSNNTGATAWLSQGIRGGIAELVVRDFNPVTPVTDLNIGSGGNDFPTFDVTCTTLVDINLIWAGVMHYNFTQTALTFTDGKNLIVGTTNGTQIATAAAQKLGFWGTAPVVQPTVAGTAQAAHVAVGGAAVQVNDTFGGWTIGEIVQALKDTGLIV